MRAIAVSVTLAALAVSIPRNSHGRQIGTQRSPTTLSAPVFLSSRPPEFPERLVIPRSGLEEAQGSLALTVGATILFGAVGAAVGAGAGYAMRPREHCYDYCGLEGFVIGGSLGVAVGTATGAYIGNGARGDWGSDFIGGVVGVAAGFGWMALTGYDTAAANIFVPVPMIVLPVVFERMSARKNSRKRQLSAQIAPAPGGLVLGLTARF